MSKTVIISGARTPIGKLNGVLSTIPAVDLGIRALDGAIERGGVPRELIDHLTFGQVLQAGAGQNPARQVGFGVGLDRTVTSETVNRVCGSGVRAIAIADMGLQAGFHTVVAAGGMDSMSRAPYLLHHAREGYRMGSGQVVDSAVADGLVCAQDLCHMGDHGSMVAAEEGVGREEQDAFALRSHTRAVAAMDRGRLAREIVPVEVAQRKNKVVVSDDEGPRRDTSMDALSRLKPVFGENSTVTAGNAPGLNDGAAALILTSEDTAREHGMPVAATILGYGQAAWDPPYLAYTPAMATEQALKRAGLSIADVDIMEINEAFASVPIISARRVGIHLDRVNPNGGAIAIGHPLAASGVRIVLSLVLELQERGGGIGVAAICSGGGMGDALVVRVD